jgi:hypothetical protein
VIPDPDPAFWDEYQSGSSVVVTKNLRKKLQQKNPPPCYRRILQISKEIIQHMKM